MGRRATRRLAPPSRSNGNAGRYDFGVPPRPSPPVVRPATAADGPALTKLLVRAFEDDPVASYMFAGKRRRQLGLHSFFKSQLLRQYMPLGHVYTTEDLGGAALWAPPERKRNSVLELMQLLPTAPFLTSPHTLGALQLMFKVENLHPTEPHWYLFSLGTTPERQGQGVGSALLRSMLERVDEAGEPAFLESSKDRNVPLYARFGFKVIEELPSKYGSPPIWRMWREPRVPER
jgi:ribosomal protein S18 acetylase RimI-like enzyme